MLVHYPTMIKRIASVLNIHISDDPKKKNDVREGYCILLAPVEFLVVEVAYHFLTPCDFSQEVALAYFSVFTMSLPFKCFSLFHFSLHSQILGLVHTNEVKK